MNRTADGVLDLLGSIVTVTLVTSVLIRGTEAAKVITALGGSFSGALRTASGK